MELQYISDNKGKTTGVFTPISQWNKLRKKYIGIDQEQVDDLSEQQKKETLKRLEEYKKYPECSIDFDLAMEEIEKDL